MVGPRAPLGKLTDHLKGMLGARPAESAVAKPSLKDLKNGGKSGVFDDSDVESSDSDSDSDSDSGDDNKSSFLRKISQPTNGASKAASPVKTKTNGAVSTPTPAPKEPAKTNGASAKKAAPKAASTSSSESESESDSVSKSEEEEEEEEPIKKTAQKNSKKTTKAESPSESSSESEEESDEEEPTAFTAKPTSKAVAASASRSSSEDTSSSSSRESSVDNSEAHKDTNGQEKAVANGADSDEEMADQSFAIAAREKGDKELASTAQFATQGFQLRRADESTDASDVTRVFREAKLQGKQLWYFTAPASVPITVVEKMTIPVEKAEQGKAILSHEGQDYGMSFDDALTSKTIKLLIPNKAGDKYSTLNRAIDKTMHLKRVTRFAQDSDDDGEAGSQLAVKAPASAKKPPRKQPEGLRARFLPIGVNDTVPSSKKRKHGDVAAPAKTTKAADSDEDGDGANDSESDNGAVVKTSKKKDAEVPVEPSPKKAKKSKSANKVVDKSADKPPSHKKPASAIPLPPIPGFTAAAVPKVTPVVPPVLPQSAFKSTASETVAKKKPAADSANILPSSSQVSFSQIDTPSKIVVDDRLVKKSKKNKKANADEDSMQIDHAEGEDVLESSPEKKKTKKEKKDKSEKKEKKDKKDKKQKKEKDRAVKDEDAVQTTPAARLSASAPKKETPVPLPRMN